MDVSLEMGMEQQVRVSPTLIAVNHVLALSSQELQALIKQEAEENPALELTENHTCNVCGEVLANGVCLVCLRRGTSDDSNAGDEFNFSALGYPEDGQGGSFSSMMDSEEFDPVSLVASEPTMRERLLLDLRSHLRSDELRIAEYILGNLDDKGFLIGTLEEMASELGISHDEVSKVVRDVQRLGPPGIAARNPRECLLLQLDYMKREQHVEPPHVRLIIEDFFVELGEHKFALIAQKLGITLDDVDTARDYIRTNLNPYPVMWADEDFATWGRPSRAQYVAPDVLIREIDGKLEVEVVESRRFFMKLNPLYNQMASELRTRHAACSEDEKRHIQQYVARTKLFISNIRQRRETLGRIARALVEYQEDYLRNGVRALKPLTRAQIAEATGLHESTVSRATAGKFVMLPSRQVVPFADFFTASLSVKDVIKEIIEKEGKPMADREIVSRLRDRGIRIARRTVAKYRSQLGILPSTLRS
jgi:RNA polymerase sigma-54 factor